ncbi:MAG TPA: PaaI family thioesterase [Methylomirabilota bacterium]|jgi:acyl-coenzyme A thioesterase PaaI-like protein|nr:PaaI family thioesterase [Methylomirabilota bacterium]
MRHTPPLPAPFETMFAEMSELRSPGLGATFHECFGCGPHHEIGLRVRCFRSDGEVLSPIIIPLRFEGPPGAAHGGIVAAYLDEVLAAAALNHGGRTHITGELTVRYVKPTPVERPLLGHGRAIRDAGRFLELEGALEDLATREVMARATGRFFPLPESTKP